MKLDRGRGICGLLLAAATGSLCCPGDAAAQTGGGNAPGADLRRQLGELAANPTSVSELIETGRTALTLGDGEAALGFFTRASQLAPMDPRVKAGLAAANTRSGRPQTALLLFTEAVAAGAYLPEIAGERGLAYDLLGQTARAQQDYLLSLRHREDPEVRRRLALSLAISGQGEAALRLLDQQVRSGDRAGSRARMMVMALSGDVRGATAAATASMPPGAAQAVAPFLSRLAALDAGQMAAAVNLGRLPSAGSRSASAQRVAPSPDPGALAFAGGGNVAALSSRLPVATAADGPRRRPGAVNSAARSPGSTDTTRTLASARTLPIVRRDVGQPPVTSGLTTPAVPVARPTQTASAAMPAGFMQPHPYEPLRLNLSGAAGSLAAAVAPVRSQPEQPVELAGANSGPRVPQAQLKVEEPVLTGAAPNRPVQLVQAQLSAAPAATAPAPSLPQQEAKPQAQPAPANIAAVNLASWTGGNASVAAAVPTARPEPAAPNAQRLDFSDVAALVSALPVERSSEKPAARAEASSARPVAASARTSRATAARTNAAARTTEAAARPATPARTAPAHPSRVWIQLAVSPNKTGFGYEINRMRRAAPDLFKNRVAHVAAMGERHRLLVGPFADTAAAQAFVNELKQKDIEALSWTSPAGTAVERLAPAR